MLHFDRMLPADRIAKRKFLIYNEDVCCVFFVKQIYYTCSVDI